MSVRRSSIFLAVVLSAFSLSAQSNSEAGCSEPRPVRAVSLDADLLDGARSLDQALREELAHRTATVRLVAMREVMVAGVGPVLQYLPNCADCTDQTPCDMECGYDPGKGGPVTCGEYGVCRGWPRDPK